MAEVYGLPLQRQVPAGFVVVDAVVVLKVLDAEGNTRVMATTTGSLTAVEAYGMVTLAGGLLRSSLEGDRV